MTDYRTLGSNELQLISDLDRLVGEFDLTDLTQRFPDPDELVVELRTPAQTMRGRILRDVAEEVLAVDGEPIDGIIRFLEGVALQLAIYADRTVRA